MQSCLRASFRSRSPRAASSAARLGGVVAAVLLFTAAADAADADAAPTGAQGGGTSVQVPSHPEAEERASSPESERVILLVRTAGDDDVMARLRAELADRDWRIVELRVDDRLGRAPLAQLARKEAVTAAVRLDSAKGVVELWILRPAGDIEEEIGTPGERTSGSVLALGTAEALRARGLSRDREPARNQEEPVAPAPRTPPSKAPETNAAPVAPEAPVSNLESVQTRPNRVWLEFGPAVTTSPGGLGPSLQALVGLRLELAERWAFGVFSLLPLTAQEVSGVEGSADVSTFLLGAVSDLSLVRASVIELSTGLGLGATISSMRGLPGPGYRADDPTVAAATGFARGSLHIRLAELWRLSARVLLGGTLPQVSIRFEDREVATWGRPLFAAALGVEVPLFGAAK